MSSSNSLPRRLGYFIHIGVAIFALHFLHNDQPFLSIHVNREGRATIAGKSEMAVSDGLLDVLRIMVASANDDEIFETASNVHLAIQHKTQIAGTQEWLTTHFRAITIVS